MYEVVDLPSRAGGQPAHDTTELSESTAELEARAKGTIRFEHLRQACKSASARRPPKSWKQDQGASVRGHAG